jgi:hypothetical protein
MTEKLITIQSTAIFDREALASVQSPILSKLNFVFTDDKPNANKQGVPLKAFDNLIDTGILMPVKMAEGGISRGHAGTTPLGVIAGMSKNLSDDTNQVLGNAALWSKERPEDINLLKECYASGDPVNISWELVYTDSTIDEDGVEWINDPIVRSATIVGSPAYMGRTPMTSVASNEENMEELEQVKADLLAAQSQITALTETLATSNAELEGLRTYKASAELKEQESALLSARLSAFAEVGIQYTPEDVEAKKAMWLKLDQESFDYLVSELKTSKSAKETEASTKTEVPAPIVTTKTKTSFELVQEGLALLKK